MLTFDLFNSKVKFASPFVWAIYIYIESIELTCISAVVKIVLIGNLRWLSSGLLSPHFLEKASGILLLPLSVCPSVRLSVRLSIMLSPPKPLDRIQPNLVSGLLTQVGHARARLFLAPPPGALGRGQKVKY